MPPETYAIGLEGGVLCRGFWLYVWDVKTPDDEHLLYVGRTGDNSSPNAQSPFNRMGQHLGYVENTNMVRRYLDEREVDPELCTLRFIAYGPILEEAPNKDMEIHKERRNVVGALEKKLRDDLEAVGYEVMNPINCKWPLDEALYGTARTAFAAEFPQLLPEDGAAD